MRRVGSSRLRVAHRVKAAAKRGSDLSSIERAGVVRSNRVFVLTSDPSHQALPHYIGRSRAVMHRRVPFFAVFRYRLFEPSRPGRL